MNPWRCWSGTFDTPVKSGPTSGPLTVSSHVIQLPHGIGPPEQFIWVPLRLVNASTTFPFGVTSIVVVPPRAVASYGVPGPNGVARTVHLVVADQDDVLARPGERRHPVVAARERRAVVGSVTGVSVSWNER